MHLNCRLLFAPNRLNCDPLRPSPSKINNASSGLTNLINRSDVIPSLLSQRRHNLTTITKNRCNMLLVAPNICQIRSRIKRLGCMPVHKPILISNTSILNLNRSSFLSRMATTSSIGESSNKNDHDNNNNSKDRSISHRSISSVTPDTKHLSKDGSSQFCYNTTDHRKVPTREIAMSMATAYSELDNQTLILLAAKESNIEARAEVLRRHIMVIDDVDYFGADKQFQRIRKRNRLLMPLAAVPYRAGYVAAIAGSFVAFPLVFHLGTVDWFNTYFVTADVPPPKDLETWLEVGTWSWNWMEPPLGTISFVLLCLQYARSQMVNLGIKPYTQIVKHSRAKRLIEAFPQYDPEILTDYSVSDHLRSDESQFT